jgi:uronate dehydrogenase
MTLLITGAGGIVGAGLRRELAPHHPRMRLFDRAPIDRLAEGEELAIGDITDIESLRRSMHGVTGIVHLAGCTTDAAIEEQIDGNIRGLLNLLEAAREAGVERVVLASSHHVVGYYPRRRRIGTDVLLRPDSRYGLTKAFAEQAGAMYADKYGLRVMCIRIGYVADQPVDRRRLSIWSSWRDLGQLVRIGLSHASLRYAVVYGVSNNTRGFFDNDTAYKLGYAPQDDAEAFAQQVLKDIPPEDETLVGTHAMGGWGANNEYVGPVARIYEW